MAAQDGAKSRDYWWTVLAVDPVALPLARRLAATGRVTADHATLLSLGLGVLVGPAYALGSRAGLVAGALLFYISFVFDCVDGKLARMQGTSSPRGQKLDEIADQVRRASAAIGLAVYLARTESGDGPVLWAVVFAVLSFLFMSISGAERGPSSGLGGAWSERLARHRLMPTPGMPDVSAIAFVIGPLLGLVTPALVLGTAMLCAAILLAVARHLRT